MRPMSPASGPSTPPTAPSVAPTGPNRARAIASMDAPRRNAIGVPTARTSPTTPTSNASHVRFVRQSTPTERPSASSLVRPIATSPRADEQQRRRQGDLDERRPSAGGGPQQPRNGQPRDHPGQQRSDDEIVARRVRVPRPTPCRESQEQAHAVMGDRLAERRAASEFTDRRIARPAGQTGDPGDPGEHSRDRLRHACYSPPDAPRHHDPDRRRDDEGPQADLQRLTRQPALEGRVDDRDPRPFRAGRRRAGQETEGPVAELSRRA